MMTMYSDRKTFKWNVYCVKLFFFSLRKDYLRLTNQKLRYFNVNNQLRTFGTGILHSAKFFFLNSARPQILKTYMTVKSSQWPLVNRGDPGLTVFNLWSGATRPINHWTLNMSGRMTTRVQEWDSREGKQRRNRGKVNLGNHVRLSDVDSVKA